MFNRPPAFILSAALALLSGAALENAPVAFAQSATARSSSLTSVMGRGMTAYFNGQSGEADRLLSLAINAGSQDPRAYYFRALARQSQGRQYEAEQDMQVGAALEARNPAMGRSIGRSLTRVQGEIRRTLEHFRREGRLAQAGAASREMHARNQHRIQQEGYVLRRPADIRVDQLVEPSNVEIVVPQAQPSIGVQPSPSPAATPSAAVPAAAPSSAPTPSPTPTPTPTPTPKTTPKTTPAKPSAVATPPVAETPPSVEPAPAVTQPDAAEAPFGFADPLSDKPVAEETPASDRKPEEPASDSGSAPAEALDEDPFAEGALKPAEPTQPTEPAETTPAQPAAEAPAAAAAATPDKPDAAGSPQPEDASAISLPEESKVEPGKVLGVLRRVVGEVAPKPQLPKMPKLPDFGPAAPGAGPAVAPAGNGLDGQQAPTENGPAPTESSDPFGDFDSFNEPPAAAKPSETKPAEAAPPVTPIPGGAPPAADASSAAEATMDGAANAEEEITQEEVGEEQTNKQAVEEEITPEDGDDPFADDPFSEF